LPNQVSLLTRSALKTANSGTRSSEAEARIEDRNPR
jgi:hypothetical protein